MSRTMFWDSCGLPAYGPNAVTWPLVYDESVSITQQIAYMMGAINQIHEMETWIKENAVTAPHLNTAVNALQTQIDKLNEKLVEDLAEQLAKLEALVASTDATTRADFEQSQAEQTAAFNADQVAQTERLTAYTDTSIDTLNKALREYIATIINQHVIWDVTVGKMMTSKDAVRRLWYWLTPDAYSLEQIGEFGVTVGEINEAGLTARGLATVSARAVPKEGWKPSGCFM